MLSRLIDQGVENRLLVVLALLATVVGGTLMVPSLNLDAFTDVSNIQVVVNTEASGLATEEVEQLITYPIEAVMYALPDVEEVRSISKTGLSVITIVFKEGTDIYFARQLVFERLQAAREQIPEGVGVPELGPNTSGLGQVFQYVLKTSDVEQFDAMRLRSLNDWAVKLLLMPVEGITDVLSFGGDVLQYQVLINPSQLLAYELTLNEVVEAIEANNRNAGGWYLDRGAEQLIVRGVGWVRSRDEGLRDIGNIPVKDVGGVAVRVGDLARVEFGPEIRQGAVTLTARDSNGNPQHAGEVVTGILLKRLGANTKSTIDAVKDRLPIIQQALPEGVRLEPIYNQADLVARAVATVTKALIEAFILILVVLFMFLINLRATLLVLISIPVSIGLALMAMAHWGISANLMSLGGLATAIGMMVDGSVVMMENIFKHLDDDEQQRGAELRVQEAAREVGRPVFFAVLIIIVVFTPLFTLEGVEGKLFQPMALAIMFATLASLVVALLALLPRLGTEFVPELEEGSLMIRVTLAPSSSLETALAVAPKLELQLMQFPEVLYASSRIGRAELGGDPEPVSNIEILVGLKPVSEWTSAADREELQDKMQEAIAAHPGLLFSFSQPIALVSDAIGGREASQVISGNERYDIYTRLAENHRDNAGTIRKLIVQAPGGALVPLYKVATVDIESGPPRIRRDDVKRRVVIQTNVEGRDMGSLVSELAARIEADINLPPGYSVVFGGQFENQQRAQAKLMIVVPLSLGLIFLPLYFAFHSVGQALLIMLNVPLALIGGVGALFLSGQYLSVPGSIGFIALFGVAVLNGVVMVNAINQLLEGGHDLNHAVFEGALSRLRPVLMTASIAALGLIPMLLANGVGAEVQRPLATVVVGGLFSSTILTLFVLPAVNPLFSQSSMVR